MNIISDESEAHHLSHKIKNSPGDTDLMLCAETSGARDGRKRGNNLVIPRHLHVVGCY
jgi:hypothetical protein